MHSYEEWTRSEIGRLRAEAEKASAEADTLQRAFAKWLELNGQKIESAPPSKNETPNRSNGQQVPARRGRRPGYGNKNAFALERIKMSPNGVTTDEMFTVFFERFGPKYKRSSMRALLWNQKKLGAIELRNGRYVIASNERSTT
jgi:hypothetical protein